MSDLARRFARALERDGIVKEGDRVVVAVSGGVDSLVLLHLLRFADGVPELELSAAHLDHGMREGSGADALWVRGLCRAWEVACQVERAESVPASEEEAREVRYRFFHRVAERIGAVRLLTAHQGDDQAETVLFRILRGTGLGGLTGIPRARWPGVYRPLLSFDRSEIEAYAGLCGIRHREDPTNRSLDYSRNVLRHRVLPAVEEEIAPAARASLRRLARLARENEEGWASLLPVLLEGIVDGESEDRISVVRPGFLSYHPSVRSRLLRELFRRAGIRPGEAGTRDALEFTRTGASGGAVDLPGGFRLSREFDRLILAPGSEPGKDRPLAIPDASPGEGEVVVGGRRVSLRWGPVLGQGVRTVFRADAGSLAFPLRVRGWCPGDRIRLPYGRKKLKKLFAEAKVPLSERTRVPVLADRLGRILWVENPATVTAGVWAPEDSDFSMGIPDAHES